MITVNASAIPRALTKRKQWVCVDEETKIPHVADGSGECASSSNPDTWRTFDQAIALVDRGAYAGVGYVFCDGDPYVGIDLDAGIEGGIVTPEAARIIKSCASYCEVSKSGSGFHILVAGKLPFAGRNNRAGVEIYTTKRYFIITGNVFVYDHIASNQNAIDTLVDTYFADVVAHGNGTKIYQPTWGKTNYVAALHPTYPAIVEGSRNVSLLSLAGQLRETGYSFNNMLRELRYVNAVACDPKVSERELRSICNNAMKYKGVK